MHLRRYCAREAPPPTGEATREAFCRRWRQTVQIYAPSLLKCKLLSLPLATPRSTPLATAGVQGRWRRGLPTAEGDPCDGGASRRRRRRPSPARAEGGGAGTREGGRAGTRGEAGSRTRSGRRAQPLRLALDAAGTEEPPCTS